MRFRIFATFATSPSGRGREIRGKRHTKNTVSLMIGDEGGCTIIIIIIIIKAEGTLICIALRFIVYELLKRSGMDHTKHTILAFTA